MDEFSHLLQQAANLKTEQLSVDRRKYDSFSEWYQHSMFADENVKSQRFLDFPTKLSYAVQYKESGNTFLHEEDYNSALIAYGNAIGLFIYLRNNDPNWKKKVSLSCFLVFKFL